MAIWIGILLWAIDLLIQWLVQKHATNTKLTERQIAKLNNAISKCRQMETEAVSLGCTPGGMQCPRCE